MSLGFTLHPSEFRRQSGPGSDGIRLNNPTPRTKSSMHASTGGAPNGNEASTKLRLEVIELALSTLSENVQEIEETIKTDQGGSSTGGGGNSNIEARLDSVERTLGMLAEGGAPVADPSLHSLSASHIRATVSPGGAQFYPSSTGDLKRDMRKTPSTLPAGAKIRLLFPQEALGDGDGRVAMGAVCVDQDMTLSTGWVIVCDTIKEKRYVHNFEM